MTAKKIDISLCPSWLEWYKGATYDTNALLDAIRKFIIDQHPAAKISVQIGPRRGDAWARVDGDEHAGSDLIDSFFFQHGTDKELFVEIKDNAERAIKIEANESPELLALSLDDCPDDEPYRSECARAWWEAFYSEAASDNRMSNVEFVRPHRNRRMLSQWNGAQFAWKRTVFGSVLVPTQRQQDAIDAASIAADLAAAKAWRDIQAELAAAADEVDQ